VKRILKSELDKFYTKEELSKNLISKIDFSKFKIVIDPCCGDGSFYKNIPIDKVGIDILPTINDNSIITHDFITWDYKSLNIDSNYVLVISNPPFGKQGSLALKFIKKSSEFANTIAFILPLSFAKESMKSKIPANFHLEYEEILPENSFLLDGEDYSVKCVFQIWTKKDYPRPKIQKINPIGFSYTKNKKDADISIRRVGIYAGKVYLETNKSEQSHYFLIFDNKNHIPKIIEILNNHEWTDLTVGPRSISKQELNKIINNILK
jgi:hypothetical protein